MINLISENQIGFKQNSRTSDHIITLKSVVDFQKSRNEKVFAAFMICVRLLTLFGGMGCFIKCLNMV